MVKPSGQDLRRWGSDFVDGLAYWNDMFFLTGDFTTTIDLDASAAVDNHSSNGLNDVFLCAYDTDGDTSGDIPSVDLLQVFWS